MTNNIDANVDELISKQAVEDLIMETDPFWCEGTTRAIFEGVKRLKPVKPKRGRWIYKPIEPLGYECSECGEGCCRFNFCPNCGAPMGIDEASE